MLSNKVKPSYDASGILDLIRFISAFTVLALHTTSIHSIPGYQAVMVFFVLSGYFIGSGVINDIYNDRWSWRNYLLNRLTRLWVVLVPALVLTLFWVTLQNAIFGHAASGTSVSISGFLGNLFFLQGAHIDTFGNNGPLWSLSYEFWYYMLFPVIILGIFSRNKGQRLIYIALTFVMAIFIFEVLGVRVLEYFLIWLLGALTSLIPRIRIRSALKRKSMIFGSLMLALASLWVPYAIMHHTPGAVADEPYMPDVLVGICFSMLIYLVISFYNETANIKSPSKAFSYLAGFSYTLYLTHYPILNFLDAWQGSASGSPINMNALVVSFGLIIMILVPYAWLIAKFTEEKTATIRHTVKNSIVINKQERVYY